MLVRFCVASVLLFVGLSPALGEGVAGKDAAPAAQAGTAAATAAPAPSEVDIQDLQKVNRACRFLLGSPSSNEKSKEQAHQWLDATKSRVWGQTTGRYLGMGYDKSGWFVRVQPKQGEAVDLHFNSLDSESQQRLKDLWNLRYYLPKRAENVRAALAKKKEADKPQDEPGTKPENRVRRASYSSTKRVAGEGSESNGPPPSAGGSSAGSQLPAPRCPCGK
jgi:hypothetical protein